MASLTWHSPYASNHWECSFNIISILRNQETQTYPYILLWLLENPKKFFSFQKEGLLWEFSQWATSGPPEGRSYTVFSFYFLMPSYRYCFLLFFAIILLFTFLWLTMTNHFNRDGSGRFICLNKELGFFLIGTFFSSLYRYFSITWSCDILCLSEKGKIPEDKTGRGTILGVNNTIVP